MSNSEFSPTLLIGIGGTGSRAVNEIYGRLKERLPEDRPIHPS